MHMKSDLVSGNKHTFFMLNSSYSFYGKERSSFSRNTVDFIRKSYLYKCIYKYVHIRFI